MYFSIDIMGYLAGIFIVSSFIPQSLKTFQTKDVQGLSLVMYSLFNIGTVFWIIYGVLLDSYPIVIFNIITFVISFPILLMIVKYRCRGENCPK